MNSFCLSTNTIIQNFMRLNEIIMPNLNTSRSQNKWRYISMLKTGMMHKSLSYSTTLVTWSAEAHVGETCIAETFFAHLCDETDGLQIKCENPHTCPHKKNIKAMCKASKTHRNKWVVVSRKQWCKLNDFPCPSSTIVRASLPRPQVQSTCKYVGKSKFTALGSHEQSTSPKEALFWQENQR